jgi:hypothetical protein
MKARRRQSHDPSMKSVARQRMDIVEVDDAIAGSAHGRQPGIVNEFLDAATCLSFDTLPVVTGPGNPG